MPIIIIIEGALFFLFNNFPALIKGGNKITPTRCNFANLPAANPIEINIFFIPGWLGALSASLSLFLSPLTVGICRRKSTRLTAVLGGLVAALGCLFTSFASQFHQLFLSYGIMIGTFYIL